MNTSTPLVSPSSPLVLIAAGGTGGHIFPGLAVAKVLRDRGYRVMWVGNPAAMEGTLVPKHHIELKPVVFYGLRGKGLKSWLTLPLHFIRAMFQALRILRQSQPAVVLGMGGYVAFFPLLMAKLKRIPTVIHEQNAVAGQVNQISSLFVNRVLSHFPNTLSKEEVVGNPVRAMDGVDLSLESLKARWSQRSGPLRLLVLGGSLGAQALNEIIPKALAEIEQDKRPMVRHQSGASHLSQLQINYQTVGVEGQCEAFIDDTLTAMQDADLLISRAGATTVAEIAALGIPSLLVPFPHAVDDHQTKNAQQLVENGAAWLVQQKNLTIEGLVAFLVSLDREKLQERAIKAYELGHRDATVRVADIVETLIKHHLPNKM